LFVIYNSLDYTKQKTLRESLSPEDTLAIRRELWGDGADGLRVLICAGRLIERKRLELALEALRVLNESSSRYRLLVVGDGPVLAEYKKIAKSLRINDRVRFVGETYSEE